MSHFINETTEEFAGYTAVITGGAAGIGLQLSRELLMRGIDRLAVLDLNVTQDACRRLTNEFGKSRVLFVKCDVSSRSDMESAFDTIVKQFVTINYVINNAGILDDVDWEREIAVNMHGTINGTLLSLKHMSKCDGGSGGVVINMSSLGGVAPYAGCPIYSAVSAAIVGLTRSLALPFHYARTDIKMMVLCPGITFTNLIKGASKNMINAATGNEFLKELSRTATQKPESVVTALLHMMLYGQNNTVWISDGGQPPYRVELPTLKELKK